MGKYTGLGAVLLAIIGFIVYYSVSFTGDLQSQSVIEPAGASMTVGEMRTNPHDSYQLNEDSYGLVGEKGMLASDFMVEVTNDLIDNKLDNSVYVVWWTFKDSEGEEQKELNPNIIDATTNGSLESEDVLQARDIIDSQKGSGQSVDIADEEVKDMVIQESTFMVNRYDNSQIISGEEAEGLTVLEKIRDIETPVNSTTYKWSMYKDALVYEDYDKGDGFNVGDIDIETHIDTDINRVEGDEGVEGTESGYPDPVEENKKFEVTFINDGKEVSKVKVNKGGSVSLPSVNLKKDGHTFKGWKGNYRNVTRNEVVQAEWELNPIKTKTFNLPEGREPEQEHTVSIGRSLYELDSYSVDEGYIEEVGIGNSDVTFKLSGRTPSRVVQTGGRYTPSDSKYVNNQGNPYYNSGGYRGFLNRFVYSGSDKNSKYVSRQRSRNYVSGDYTGTLSRYLYSGSYTPSRSKYVTGQTSSYYSSGGYRGSLSRYVYSGSGDKAVYRYRGTVTRPSSDTSVYRYRGTVTKPDTRVWKYRGYVEKGESDTRTYQNYYRYKVTVNYREK